MSRVKVTCEIHDYSEPSKPNIRIHSHELKFQGRRAISLDEIKSTIRGLFE